VVLHVFLPGAPGPGALLLHAVQIAGGYVLWFAALGVLLALAIERGWMGPVRVWHVWLLSALCYLLGYFAVTFDDALTVALHPDVHDPRPLSHFLRLLPVWLLVTWVFTEGYLGRNRRAAIERLTKLNSRLAALNARLAAQDARLSEPPDESQPQAGRVLLESGRSALDLPADAVLRVSVDDHHCYVHHLDDGRLLKTAFGVPLKALLPALPPCFLRVHRSHVVNLRAVAAVERQGRGYRLRLTGQTDWVPVSRQRAATVLERIEGDSVRRPASPAAP